jgi:hypothetical protein
MTLPASKILLHQASEEQQQAAFGVSPKNGLKHNLSVLAEDELDVLDWHYSGLLKGNRRPSSELPEPLPG